MTQTRTPKPWELTATEIAQAVNRREFSSLDVIEAHMARIEQINPIVNAVTHPLTATALAMAKAQDACPCQQPLTGVPFTIKENIDVYGSATSQGIPALKNAMPLANAPIVERMIAAGAIPIARTNLPEFALRLCTDNPLYGATINPWNEYLTPGGSSGGDAVAIATGMAPVGLGNDTGGSLRNPAYCCGVTALKPTLGRVPSVRTLTPKQLGLAMQLMQVEGPMARSVTDLRTMLSAISGHHPHDTRSKDVPLIGNRYPRKVGLVTTIDTTDIPPVTVDEIKRIGRLLEKQGYEVENVTLPELDVVNRLWGEFYAKDLQGLIKNIQPLLSRPVHLFLADMVRAYNSNIPDQQLLLERDRLQQHWSALFQQTPVFIMPTWTQLPWPVDADLDANYGIKLLQDTTATITPANLLGFPSIAVPTGLSDGLPTGVQVMSDLWREDICLDIAELIERHCPMPTPMTPN